MAIDDKELETLMPALTVDWTEDAKARMLNVPFSFARVWCEASKPLPRKRGWTL